MLIPDLDLLIDHTDPKTARRVLREAAARDLARNDPDLVQEFKVRTAYRLARELARTLGMLPHNSALSSVPETSLLLPPSHALVSRFCPQDSPLRAVALARQHPYPLYPSQNQHFRNGGAAGFEQAINATIDHMQIRRTDYGEIALQYLVPVDPANWPTLPEVYDYEVRFISEILDHLIDHGTRLTSRMLEEHHGCRFAETRELIAVARLEARAQVEADVEEDRAILQLRTESLARRARDNMDLRVELAAIKQLSLIQGITKIEPEDANSELARIVHKVSNMATQKELPHGG